MHNVIDLCRFLVWTKLPVWIISLKYFLCRSVFHGRTLKQNSFCAQFQSTSQLIESAWFTELHPASQCVKSCRKSTVNRATFGKINRLHLPYFACNETQIHWENKTMQNKFSCSITRPADTKAGFAPALSSCRCLLTRVKQNKIQNRGSRFPAGLTTVLEMS